jgi:hypothetical protein
MAYRNYNNEEFLSFGGLKGITNIDLRIEFKDNELFVKTHQKLDLTRDIPRLEKLGFSQQKTFSRSINFKTISECYNFFFKLIPTTDQPEFRDDFRRFVFTNFNLTQMPQGIKSKLNMSEIGVDKKLQALQKLYKD